ncbi:FOSLN [Lepeophtheirus salmonis]|uniref:FOSLN n=1 Tax=Lepeophtheirus salmonis TaxID=72036 RepID=A0A7R8HBD4_LEPSM|nr:FOSLN [Lepeophtheirus salmonis]CAF2971571.1 FOSLN [Lepeophtheirus salmonis]
MKPKTLTRSTVAENLGISVLTPTTLKSISQILDSNGGDLDGGSLFLEEDSYPIPSVILPNEGGSTSMTRSTFVNSDAKSWQGGTTTVVTPTSLLPQTILDKQDQDKRKENINYNNNSGVLLPRKRNIPRRASGGGRKPSSHNKNGQLLSPEEEARLNVRRERNKEAAARCRKRRVDQTNDLLELVEEQEKIKRSFEEEIRSLQCTKEEIQYILQSHSKTCCLPQHSDEHLRNHHPSVTGVVPVPQQQQQQQQVPSPSSSSQQQRHQHQVGVSSQVPPPTSSLHPTHQRPTSLPLLQKSPSFMDSFIETPSSALNFDSLLTTSSSTGLTPLANIPTPVIFSPTCSTQQREHEKSNCDSVNLVSL